MNLRGKKLGLLLSTAPGHPGFEHGLRLAHTALLAGVAVYVYCIDEAVTGVGDARLQALKAQGLKLFACAYGAHRRHRTMTDQAVFAGLTVVSDVVSATDRFVAFN